MRESLQETDARSPDVGPAQGFEYQSPRAQVLMKPGAIGEMAEHVEAIGARRLMLVSGGRSLSGPIGAAVRSALGGAIVATFDGVVEHSAGDTVMRAAEMAEDARIDGLVAVGGGSASDTAKGAAIVLAEGGRIEDHASSFIPPDRFIPKHLHEPKLPIVAVPTTASAAEVTPGLGILDDRGVKRLFWDVKLASRLIVLDPEANVAVPPGVMAATAMNAFAHCAEGLYSRLRNPISEGLALQGLRILTRAVPDMVADPADVGARGRVLAGAHISGLVISNARVGVHHAICHCLGARGGLSHGVANSIMLPHAIAYNLAAAAPELARMAEAMGIARNGRPDEAMAEAGVAAIREMQAKAGVPTRLRDTGLDKALLPAIAADAMNDRGLYFNPRRTDSPEPLLALLEEAW